MAILLIDDDRELCELLSAFLQQEGFAVETAHRFVREDWSALRERIELVVLDVGLPGLNGFEVLRLLRADGHTVPVLMLTARGDDVDRIVGLELGADDYLPKPCNPRELSARIRAILRRVDGGASTRSSAIAVSGVVLDPATRTVLRGDERLQMTSTEFNVLERLMRDAGQIVAKDALMRDALGRRLRPFDRAIDMHISSIRRKLGDDLVRTVRGLGYQFVRR
jgi:two-component system, OmpR family, response regulator CpxR